MKVINPWRARQVAETDEALLRLGIHWAEAGERPRPPELRRPTIDNVE
jgi:hypothetical protein